MSLPTGYLRSPAGEVVFDPDEEVQPAVRAVFAWSCTSFPTGRRTRGWASYPPGPVHHDVDPLARALDRCDDTVNEQADDSLPVGGRGRGRDPKRREVSGELADRRAFGGRQGPRLLRLPSAVLLLEGPLCAELLLPGPLEHTVLLDALRELRREGYTAGEIAAQLNAAGWRTPTQRNGFNKRLVRDDGPLRRIAQRTAPAAEAQPG